ncbi:DUF2637 domain-containing protein [Glycomyces lechevalierae]|uniref:DUF2637 domain-containing protein n=2 Tax=Bacteria TaxID=2 RepID=A0ABU2AI19_9ACTN|nr:DUF2637 domain-containing protein [Glycomyces lechevalierae]MDR7336864.1 hypothetical protein [Glycomyces lechevalierae]
MATTTVQAPPAPAQTREIDTAATERAASEAESKAAAKVRKVAGTTEARIAERDAESVRKLREREVSIELRRKEIEVARLEREAKAAAKETRRNARAKRRNDKRKARLDRLNAAALRVYLFIAGNMPSVYSSLIYGMSLSVAIYGQINMATDRGWPVMFGIGMAVFLEGLALSMALTAHQLRLRNERALIPAAMTWIAAGFASAINVLAHRDDPILAAVLGASSLAAIIVWEVRSGAKHRAVLRDKGWIPEPPERFGLRRWIRYPRSTFRAWSLDVKDRVGDGAAVLLARVETAVQNAAAAGSAEAAAAAQAAAAEAAETAARESTRARAAAAEAHRAARRAAAPRRSLWALFSRTAKEALVELAPAPKAAPVSVKTPRPAKPAELPASAAEQVTQKATQEPDAFAKVEKAFVDLYVSTGKRPGVRALEDAVKGAKKRSAIHTWTKKNAGLLDELSVRAEAIRSGQSDAVEVSA